jgi:ATP synthase protein I
MPCVALTLITRPPGSVASVMPDEKTPKKGFAEYFGISDSAMRLSSVGLTLVFSTFIGFGLGWFLDRIFKTHPLLTILLLLFGIVAGFVNVWRAVRIEQEPDEEEEDEQTGNSKRQRGSR